MALVETIFRRHPIPSSSSDDPATLTYEPIPPTSEHDARITRLGIEESLLRPALPPRPPTTKARSLAELPRDYRPARFRLVHAPGQAKSDAWFETLFGAVYARARRFAEAHFGGGDVPGAPEDGEVDDSLWAGEFGKEFLAYAGLAARQDNSDVIGGGAWEAVLRSGAERTALACGVVARALEDGAWDRLLFGATGAQRRVLDELDRGMIDCDGMYHFFLQHDQPTCKKMQKD